MEWCASRFIRENNHVKSASARVHRGRSAGTPWGESCAGRASRKWHPSITSLRSRSRRPVAVPVENSLGQRPGMVRAPLWPRRQPRRVRQRAHAPWAVGRLSTGRSARGPRGTNNKRYDHIALKPQPPTCHGVGEEEPRPMAWGGVRPSLAAKTTTPSSPPRACSVDGRPDLHGAKPTRAARHGRGTLSLRRFKAAAAGLSKCWMRAASANGVEWCAPLFGREDNHARSPSARVHRERSARDLRAKVCAGRAAWGSNAVATSPRSHSRQPGAASMNVILVQWREAECAPS